MARNTLLVLRNKRTALDEKDTKVPAVEWLAGVLFSPEKADGLKTFLIDHDQVLGLLGKKLASDGKHFSYTDLEPHLAEIESSARKQVKSNERNKIASNKTSSNYIAAFCSTANSRTPWLLQFVPAESSETLDQIGVAEFFFDPKKIRTAPPSTNASVP